MNLNYYVERDVCVISVLDEYTEQDTKELLNYVKPFKENTALRGIILDFGELNFITSTGLGAIMQIYKELEVHHIELAVCVGHTKLKQLIGHMGLNKIIRICESKEEALADMGF